MRISNAAVALAIFTVFFVWLLCVAHAVEKLADNSVHAAIKFVIAIGNGLLSGMVAGIVIMSTYEGVGQFLAFRKAHAKLTAFPRKQ